MYKYTNVLYNQQCFQKKCPILGFGIFLVYVLTNFSFDSYSFS